MAYNLGPVKEHTRRVAETVGPMFGITVVYGWRASDPISPDHPDGVALDFMTPRKSVGDALVAYLIANHVSLGVDYIIWYGRSWNSRRKTWVTYTGSNRHTDHVHLTLLRTVATGLSGGGLLPVGNPISAYSETLEKLETLFKLLTDKGTWVRLGLGAAGVVLIMVGVLGASRVQDLAMKAVNSGK